MIRIAIADDHVMVRQALRRVLEASGDMRVVAEIDSGLQVADAVAGADVDVLILDMDLPGLHGLDALRQVVKRSSATRVLVLSADGREQFVIGAIRNGASGYVLKGADLGELVSAIAALARGGRFISPALSDCVIQALVHGADGVTDDPYETLTDREREVFHLMAEGLTNSEIGSRLFVSPRTIESHRGNILRKLNLRSQTEVVRYAIGRGLLSAIS